MFISVWFKSRQSIQLLGALVIAMVALVANPRFATAQGAGYWHTSGNQILDANGVVVRIAGINWYGFETTDEVVHGLYAQDYHTILNTIHAEGYNTIRLPYSNQMVETPIIPTTLATGNAGGPINTDLVGLNSLQIMDKVISAAGALGLKVILVNHRSEAGNSNEPNGLWYTATYPEAKWIADWKTLVTRYKTYVDSHGNPIVIAVDLRNEPHLLAGGARTGSCWTGDTWTNGCPVTNTAQNWPAAATRAAKAILAVNPNLLIAVEGTDCYSGDCGWQGGNLEGAGSYPLQLSVANRLVYSAHDYGPDLSTQNWFTSTTSASTLTAAWNKQWAYLSQNLVAPVWLGEFGTTNTSTDIQNSAAGSQGQWFSALVSFLANHPNINWTYWAVNGEDDFGLLDKSYDAIPVSSIKQQMLSSLKFNLVGLGGAGGTPTCGTTPAVPTTLAATTVSYSSAQLGWKAVSTPTNCTVTYTVYRSTVSGFTPASTNQVASGLASAAFTDSNLTASTTYYYKVVAVDAHGSSASSSQASAKTLAKPAGAACHVAYTVTNSWSTGFQAGVTIQNTGTTSLTGWTLQWTFANGQTITSFWGGAESQTAAVVTVTDLGYNGPIAPGGSVTGIGFTANIGTMNATPTNFTLNGVLCK